MKKKVIHNIGTIVSGDFDRGIVSGDTIVIEEGKIMYVGPDEQAEYAPDDLIIDANQCVACPGLIDPHVHVGYDDYAPMQRMVGFMEETLLTGTTTLISEGEQSPGLPRFYENDPQGVKAQAILAKKVYNNYRPGGYLKVHGGALVLSDGLTRQDFADMHKEGVWLVGEIGGGGLASPLNKVLKMLEWAREFNMFFSVHYGPALIPGATEGTTDIIKQLKPDKVAHVNGGTTAASWADTRALIEETDFPLELVPYGNPKSMFKIIELLKERGELRRILFGSDTPTGQGIMPCAMHRAIVGTSSLHEIPAEKAIAMASGNTADLYRLNTGKLEVGKEADIVLIAAPTGSVGKDALAAIEAGDLFGPTLIIVDGNIVGFRGRDTRPTRRHIIIAGESMEIKNINDYLFNPPIYKGPLFRQ